jgi:hypothetical protein
MPLSVAVRPVERGCTDSSVFLIVDACRPRGAAALLSFLLQRAKGAPAQRQRDKEDRAAC